MMRRLLLSAVALSLSASVASAQMPPSISKPIEAAKKAAGATNAQINAQQQVSAPAKPLPAPVTKQSAPAPTAKPAAPVAKPAAPAPQASRGAAPMQGKAAAAPAKGAPAKVDAKAQAEAPVVKEEKDRITFDREVFAYVAEGKHDPFASPIETGEIRPLVADLHVTGIIYDPSGRNSVAVMRDVSTQEQYRVKTGQVLGRARVAQIKPQAVVMSIDEYGVSRQEILKLNVQAQQTKGKP